ncbi:MAG TPA: hypothetical protein VFK97_02125 [Candidatus Saccharimonadales bacterium]|nr:hypothetical protein [Candidatus Saccharimonadales bacterium]
MRRVSSGYTIIEVSIFLAISLVIAAATWNLIGGKQNEAAFDQKMHDTQTQLQGYINDVSNGFSGGNPASQNCTIASSLPLVKAGAPGAGYTPSCIFLGKAIQFNDATVGNNQDEQLYIYSVFGCRIISCSATSAQLPDSMTVANPNPADGSSGQVDLTATFDLSPAHVLGVCSMSACGANPVQTNQSHLIGFFNSFNANAQSNGAEDLNVYQYPFKQNAAKDSGLVTKCLQVIPPGHCHLTGHTNPPSLTNYEVCLTDGQRYAVISITSNSGIGATVKLDFTTQSQCYV